MNEPESYTVKQIRELNGAPPLAATPSSPAAAELISAGAVEIVEKTARHVRAEVAGRSGTRRRVEHDGGRWHCSCPAFLHRHKCAHLDAVQLIVAEPGRRRLRPEAAPENRELTDA
jgi:uncharacterized Zn finger protein